MYVNGLLPCVRSHCQCATDPALTEVYAEISYIDMYATHLVELTFNVEYALLYRSAKFLNTSDL